MNKSEFKIVPHLLIPDTVVIEVWHNEEFIATVAGADGPGIRVITKHPYDIIRGGAGEQINVIEVKIELEEKESPDAN